MSLSTPANILLLVSLSLVYLSSLCKAHGMMCTPRQRAASISVKCGNNLQAPPDVVIDHCAHCLNGGTVATVKGNLPKSGWKVFEPTKDFRGTADRAGLCGDPKGRHEHMIGGHFMPYKTVPIVANWKKGAHVDFTAELDTNHNGYFEYYICNLDKCRMPDISGKCFQKGFCKKLLRVPHRDCQDEKVNTDYECGPIDHAYPGRWYVPCRKTGHVGVHIVGGPAGTMRYKLPDNFECQHCVVQWYWATANSCAPRGFLEYFKKYNNPFGTTCESDGGGRGAHRPGMAQCGGQVIPEEFWSCADVQITKTGKSAGQVKAVGKPKDDIKFRSNDQEAAKEDPELVIEKAAESLEEDVTMTANESSGERKRQEVAAASGDCILEDSPCNAAVHCCNVQQVCVYTVASGGFTCRFWWSLWQDVEAREKGL